MDYTKCSHLVVDIETLGTEIGCPIIQIGAVSVKKEFGQWVIENVFSQSVTIESNIFFGFTKFSDETISFWGKNKDAFSDIFKSEKVPVDCALESFVKSIPQGIDYFWSKGTDFDFPILKNAIRRFGFCVPWKYHQVRDLRTIMNPLFTGDYNLGKVVHTAISDALLEAKALICVMERMEKSIEYPFEKIGA